MVFYPRRKPNTRAKRNFKKVARKMVRKTKPRFVRRPRYTTNTDNILKLKTKQYGSFKKTDFFANTSDGSMFLDILFNVTKNLSVTPTVSSSTSACNCFYHPDTAVPQQLYRQYRTTCIVMEFYRPSIAINYGNEEVGPANQIRQQDVPLGTKIMHTKIVYQPDNTTNAIQPDAVLTPRLNLAHPTTWKEGVDDGKTFVNHRNAKIVKRIFKPIGIERRWRNKGASSSSEVDDQEISMGGIHLRYKSRNALDILNSEELQWHAQDDATILNFTATIYTEYKDRY